MAITLAGIGLGFNVASLISGAYGQRKSLQAQAETSRLGAKATFAEAEDLAVSSQFDIGRLRQQNIRDLAEIEADLGDIGQGIGQNTFQIMEEAITELELGALLEERKAVFEESQLRLSAKAQKRQAQASQEASRRTFLGIKI